MCCICQNILIELITVTVVANLYLSVVIRFLFCLFVSLHSCLFIIDIIASHQIASEGLKHRVVEASLADLQGDEDHAYRKIRLRVEDVQGKNVLTNFWVCQSLRL